MSMDWTEHDEKCMEKNLLAMLREPKTVRQFLDTEGLEILERPTKNTFLVKFLYRDEELIKLPEYWNTYHLN